ncbi:hypothetical protein PGT21_013731 [Puccinia graminis f. sp. tritici]|uniref:Uncharacterized protein n=1 Tax=Puccinia graminis f. sp. tritici TaxID=56615 RepID=A0A5B0SN68_PUCGR|nr:hypothetical protein PGT21_013731 [Puccinia graminis f. sp. tritici]KAA1138583.1 hypothetical protein PGTUg99_030065 [Puccinia graminis f. sp. tritici]
MYASSSLSQFTEKPGMSHWLERSQCWKYLKAREQKAARPPSTSRYGVTPTGPATLADPMAASQEAARAGGVVPGAQSCGLLNWRKPCTEADLTPHHDLLPGR